MKSASSLRKQGRAGMQIKVYLVLQRVAFPKPGEERVRVLDAKLTRQLAQDIVDQTPGTWVEKVIATKH
jgi:hypothetical protein